MSGREMWAVTCAVILPYLFDDETVIALCIFIGDGQGRNGEDVMICDARYVLAR